jgi:hypothetical protein
MFQLEEALRFWEPPALQVVAKAPPRWKKNLLHQGPSDEFKEAA